jgi:hypothetical protein
MTLVPETRDIEVFIASMVNNIVYRVLSGEA